MSFSCPICNNKRHIFKEGKGWVRCECIGQLRANRLMSTSGFPDLLWSVESGSFKPGNNTERQRLAQGIISIVKQYDKTPIFIYSDSPDKDRVSAIICRYTAIIHESVKSISYTTIDQLVQRQFGKDSANLVENPFSADITVISIGREMTNMAHRSALYSILYDRLLSEKFTIICSSIPKNRIIQVYQKSIDNLMEKNFIFYSC